MTLNVIVRDSFSWRIYFSMLLSMSTHCYEPESERIFPKCCMIFRLRSDK